VTILAFGYLEFILFAIIIIYTLSFVCCLCIAKRDINQKNNRVVAKVPYLKAVSSLLKRQYKEE